MYQAIVFSAAALAVLLISFLYKNREEKSFKLLLKIITVAFCVIGFFRFMLSDSFVWMINGGFYGAVYYDRTDVLASLLRWSYYISYSVLPMAVFFKTRLFKNIACFFCLPSAILSTIFFNNYMGYFLSPEGRGLHLVPWIRYTYFCIELTLAILIPLLILIKERHRFNVKDPLEWRNILVFLPLIILQAMPVYIPQSLIGYTALKSDSFTPLHFIWLAITVAEILFLYYTFRFRSYEDRYALVVFLTILLFFHYDSLYLMGFMISRLPIQLCNLASYFYMIAIIFKNRPLFNFCYVVNVVGTGIAMTIPDMNPGALGFWNMHFMLEHMLVMIIPILCMNLRIFPRIDRSALKHSAVGFSIYFVFCLVSGTILNNVSDETVNFFYLFSIEKATDYFPFLKFVENFPLVIKNVTLYPIMIAIIFFAFSALYIAWYFVIFWIYKINDDHAELRRARISLVERITGKPSKAPRYYED